MAEDAVTTEATPTDMVEHLPSDLAHLAGRGMGVMGRFLDMIDEHGLAAAEVSAAARVTTVAYKPVQDAIKWTSVMNKTKQLRLMEARHEARRRAGSEVSVPDDDPADPDASSEG